MPTTTWRQHDHHNAMSHHPLFTIQHHHQLSPTQNPQFTISVLMTSRTTHQHDNLSTTTTRSLSSAPTSSYGQPIILANSSVTASPTMIPRHISPINHYQLRQPRPQHHQPRPTTSQPDTTDQSLDGSAISPTTDGPSNISDYHTTNEPRYVTTGLNTADLLTKALAV